MPESSGEITRLLGQLRAGDQDINNQLVPLLYDELRRIAGALMQRERPGHTMQATAVVHEAYMRLIGEQQIEWQNRAHFYAIAAKTMRRVLRDYARNRHAQKRGGAGAVRMEIDPDMLANGADIENVAGLDDLLERLTAMDADQGRIVELRFFGGLNVDETAEVMGISPSTVKREWRSAKAWLDRELSSSRIAKYTGS
jgi:RNA polymerase sigma factor (TIGR02999 family)